MADSFKDIKKELKKSLNLFDQKLNLFNRDQELSYRQDVFGELREKINEADKEMKNLDVEYELMPMNFKSGYQGKYRSLRQRYEKARKDFMKAEEQLNFQKNRNNLMKDHSGNTIAKDARAKHVTNIDKLHKQDGQIDNTKRVAIETENTAKEVLVDLKGQGHKIRGAIQDAKDLQGNVGAARRIVVRMTRKEFCYKIVLYLAVIVLFVAILVVLVVKLMK